MSEEEKIPPSWQKAKILIAALGTILIPLTIAVIGHGVNSALKERELSLNYVKLAVGILQEEPKKETENLRKWAIDVVNNYSTVKLSNKAIEELEKQELPKPIYKLARSPYCGVEKYKECRSPEYGKDPNNPAMFQAQRGPLCGIELYNMCRHPSHGIESNENSSNK